MGEEHNRPFAAQAKDPQLESIGQQFEGVWTDPASSLAFTYRARCEIQFWAYIGPALVVSGAICLAGREIGFAIHSSPAEAMMYMDRQEKFAMRCVAAECARAAHTG